MKKYIVILTILTLIFVSCSNNGTFYILANEELIVSNDSDDLGDNASVSGMELFNDKYYLSAGGLYSRERKNIDNDNIPDWASCTSAAELGVSGDNLLFHSLASLNNSYLLASYSYENSSSMGYGTAISSDGTTWTTLSGTSFDTLQTAVFSASDRFFVSTLDSSGNYSTYSSTDGSSFTELTGFDGERLMSAAHDGSDFYITGRNDVYTGNGTTFSAMAYQPAMDSEISGYNIPNYLTCIKYITGFDASADALYLTSKDGYLYRDSGSAWVAYSQVQNPDDNDYALGLDSISLVTLEDGDEILLAGTSSYDSSGGYGFFYLSEYDSTGLTDAVDTSVVAYNLNYKNTDLAISNITDMFVDSEASIPTEYGVSQPFKVFALTGNKGLWRIKLGSNDKYNWFRE